eukprot:7637649-Pyramimonas_sp.AAC.1
MTICPHAGTPGIEDPPLERGYNAQGALGPDASSVLMKILYLAWRCRFDLAQPVCMLARGTTRWNCECDKRLRR